MEKTGRRETRIAPVRADSGRVGKRFAQVRAPADRLSPALPAGAPWPRTRRRKRAVAGRPARAWSPLPPAIFPQAHGIAWETMSALKTLRIFPESVALQTAGRSGPATIYDNKLLQCTQTRRPRCLRARLRTAGRRACRWAYRAPRDSWDGERRRATAWRR